MISLCSTSSRKECRAAGALILSVTTISTADTALQLVDTEPSRNRALHTTPAANGRLVTAVSRSNLEDGDAATVEDHESVEAAHNVL